MGFAVSVLLSGIAVGGQYALIAIGYTMVYGILGFTIERVAYKPLRSAPV